MYPLKKRIGIKLSEKAIYLVLIGVLSAASFAFGNLDSAKPVSLDGRVVGVIDGDTLDVLTPEKKTIRVRLAGIDAPEKKQPFGMKAKAYLSDKAYGCDVVLSDEKLDRYGRTVAHVTACSKDINAAMVEAGYAWVYVQYASRADEQAWLPLQRIAQEQKRGLWADQETPIPPWEWRKNSKKH